MRGRPPYTRRRVLNYWSKHGPCPVMQVVRETGADRRYVQRMKNSGWLNLTACAAIPAGGI